MSVDMTRLERIVGTVLRLGVAASSACLTLGLVLMLVGGAASASLLLQVGIVILLVTPVARVVVSLVQYAGARDWTFVTLTAIVLAELMASAVAALVFNKRL
jgi:uncharacterized membrane protein